MLRGFPGSLGDNRRGRSFAELLFTRPTLSDRRRSGVSKSPPRSGAAKGAKRSRAASLCRYLPTDFARGLRVARVGFFATEARGHLLACGKNALPTTRSATTRNTRPSPSSWIESRDTSNLPVASLRLPIQDQREVVREPSTATKLPERFDECSLFVVQQLDRAAAIGRNRCLENDPKVVSRGVGRTRLELLDQRADRFPGDHKVPVVHCHLQTLGDDRTSLTRWLCGSYFVARLRLICVALLKMVARLRSPGARWVALWCGACRRTSSPDAEHPAEAGPMIRTSSSSGIVATEQHPSHGVGLEMRSEGLRAGRHGRRRSPARSLVYADWGNRFVWTYEREGTAGAEASML